MKNIFQKINKFKKISIWLLVLANITLASSYTYGVNNTVFNVVATDRAEKALSANNAAIADLESKYISLTNNLTLDFALAQGYQDASGHQIYVPNKATLTTLSFNAL